MAEEQNHYKVGGKINSKRLRVIKNIFDWEKNINNNNALQIIIEIDEQIKYEAEELAKNFYPHKKIKIINDIANKPRILSIN